MIIPEKGSMLGSDKFSKYCFDNLGEYGDSTFVDCDVSNKREIHRIRDAAYKFGKYHGIKIATRMSTTGLIVYHAGEKDE